MKKTINLDYIITNPISGYTNAGWGKGNPLVWSGDLDDSFSVSLNGHPLWPMKSFVIGNITEGGISMSKEVDIDPTAINSISFSNIQRNGDLKIRPTGLIQMIPISDNELSINFTYDGKTDCSQEAWDKICEGFKIKDEKFDFVVSQYTILKDQVFKPGTVYSATDKIMWDQNSPIVFELIENGINYDNISFRNILKIEIN